MYAAGVVKANNNTVGGDKKILININYSIVNIN